MRVPVAPERAFALFTEQLGSWWPAEYTWSADALEGIEIEARPGGHCVERGPGGFRCDWGTVVDCEPARRLLFSWQIGPSREPLPDPARASEVEVQFVGDGGSTEVRLEHRGFERHGEQGDSYREALGSEQGWPYILGRLVEAAA